MCTLIESDAVEPSGRAEGGTRPGRTCKKPKDLTTCDSEEGGCGEGCLREGGESLFSFPFCFS